MNGVVLVAVHPIQSEIYATITALQSSRHDNTTSASNLDKCPKLFY